MRIVVAEQTETAFFLFLYFLVLFVSFVSDSDGEMQGGNQNAKESYVDYMKVLNVSTRKKGCDTNFESLSLNF